MQNKKEHTELEEFNEEILNEDSNYLEQKVKLITISKEEQIEILKDTYKVFNGIYSEDEDSDYLEYIHHGLCYYLSSILRCRGLNTRTHKISDFIPCFTQENCKIFYKEVLGINFPENLYDMPMYYWFTTKIELGAVEVRKLFLKWLIKFLK